MPLSEVILIIMGLLTLAMIAAGLCRNLPIPYTVFLVVLGMLLTWLTHRVPSLEPLQDFRLTPDLVFFVFLPALIFESALNLDARQLIKDIAPIMASALTTYSPGSHLCVVLRPGARFDNCAATANGISERTPTWFARAGGLGRLVSNDHSAGRNP